MKKISTIIIISLLCLSMFSMLMPSLKVQSTNETTIFSDSFESYAVGTFPSSGGWELVWNGMGDQYQVITNAYYVSPTKSLQLWGNPNDWSAVVQRHFSSTSRFMGYEVSMLVSAVGYGGPGRVDYVGFFNREAYVWGKYYATVQFNHDTMNIITDDGSVVGTWTTGTWYSVKVLLDRTTNTYSVWINGQLKGTDFKTSNQDTNIIDAFSLQSDHPGVKDYFDGVRVFESSGETGLVGYWKFDEGSGNIAHDSSGNGNEGTVNGASWTGGISNGALQFDGISNYVGIPSSPSLTLSGNQVSLELWIKPTVTLNSGLASRINIMDKGDGYGFQMEANDARINFFVNIGYADQWLSSETSNWKAGTWYHIAGTYDGTNERIYVNSVLENTKSLSGTLSGIGDPLSIGSYCYGTMNFFNGTMDEVKIYSYARTAEEISSDYSSVFKALVLKTLWATPVTDNTNFASDIGDVDGDGNPEVAVLNLHWPSGPATVQVLRNDGTTLWATSINFAATGIAVKDTNLDGKAEVYVFGTTGIPPHYGDPIIACFDANGHQLWQFTRHETSPWSRDIDWVSFVNLDSDPQLEIFCGGGGWGDYTNYALDTNGALMWTFSTRDIGSDWKIGDVNGDGANEIVLFSYQEIYILSESGNLLRTIKPHASSAYAHGALGDVNGDGVAEIVDSVGAYDPKYGYDIVNTLYVYKGDGTLLWSKSYSLGPDGSPTNPVLVDLDGDGVKDVVLFANKSINAYKGDGTVLWTFDGLNPTQPWSTFLSVISLQRGEPEEILFQCDQQLYVLSLDGKLIQSLTVPNQGQWVGSGNMGENPSVTSRYCTYGDVNKDGINELVEDELINGQHYVVLVSIASPQIMPDFEISVTPEYAVADPHSTTEYTVNVTSLHGFNQPVTLSAVYSSHELSGSFGDTVVTPPSDGSITTTLTVSVLSEAINTHQIYVTGTSGTLSHTKTATLHVPFMSVPYYFQGDTGWCVPTSVAMVLRFYGVDVHPWDVAYALYEGHGGVGWPLGPGPGAWTLINTALIEAYMSGISLAHPEMHLTFEHDFSITEERIKQMLSRGPVVFQQATSILPPSGHAVVLTGYEEIAGTTYFFVNDPGCISMHYEKTLEEFGSALIGSWIIGVGGNPDPPRGILNVIGGGGYFSQGIWIPEFSSLWVFSSSYTDSLRIYQSGFVWNPLSGDTAKLSWRALGNHAKILTPEDRFKIGVGLTLSGSNYEKPSGLIINPTNLDRDYKFEAAMIDSGGNQRWSSGLIDVPGVYSFATENPSYSFPSMREMGIHYGKYTLVFKLYSPNGILLDKTSMPEIRYVPTIRVSMHSPANLLITDPLGRSTGVDPSGQIVSQIPDATYSNTTESQVIMIPDPINGSYNIRLHGTGSGSYTLTTELITYTGTAAKTYSGQISLDEIQTLVASISGTELALNSPSPTHLWIYIVLTGAFVAAAIVVFFAVRKSKKKQSNSLHPTKETT